VKKRLLWFAVVLFLATVSAPPIARADVPDPTCDPNGCTKPGQMLAVLADLPLHLRP
jgi:hypothetical protein